MTNANATAIRIFPHPVSVATIPLPEAYPLLPLNNFQFQPVAYTQSTSSMAFVTVLIPLLPHQQVVAPGTIEKIVDDSGCYFRYNIVVRGGNGVDYKTLALFSFSFLLNLPVENSGFKINLTVTDGTQETDILGRVVMDSNMLPSW